MFVRDANNLITLGRLTADLQRPRNELQRAVWRLGIEPTMRLNGMAYFAESDAKRLASYFRGQGAQSDANTA